MEAIRFDRAILGPSWEETPEGFLRVHATFSRTGLQSYRNADGSARVEYRPESEVTREDAFLSLGGIPVTLEHPPELLTPDTVKEYQQGASGTRLRYDNGFVSGTLTLTGRDVIEAVKRKDAVEVSVGYRVDYDPTPGEVNGQRYDGIQRNISANHIAVVRTARGGSDLRVHFDSADVAAGPGVAVAVAADPIPCRADGLTTPDEEPSNEEEPMTTARSDEKAKTPRPDPEDEYMEEEMDPEGEGAEEEMDPEDEDSEEAMDACGDKRKDSGPVVSKARYDAVLRELEIERGRNIALNDRLDAIEERQREIEQERLDAADIDIDQLVSDRIELLEQAATFTGERQTYDGLSAREVRLEAMERRGIDVSRFDGRSDDAVAAAFETYLDAIDKSRSLPYAAPRIDSPEALSLALGRVPRTDAEDDIEKARAEMVESQRAQSAAAAS